MWAALRATSISTPELTVFFICIIAVNQLKENICDEGDECCPEVLGSDPLVKSEEEAPNSYSYPAYCTVLVVVVTHAF